MSSASMTEKHLEGFYNLNTKFTLHTNDILVGEKGFPSGSVVTKKIHLPIQETWIWSLGEEGPLEKGMATHSNILAREIPWTEEPGGLQSMGSQERQTQLSD